MTNIKGFNEFRDLTVVNPGFGMIFSSLLTTVHSHTILISSIIDFVLFQTSSFHKYICADIFDLLISLHIDILSTEDNTLPDTLGKYLKIFSYKVRE
jgi:hypothetical protein